ncbi:Protein EARLY RESPONSIVE TO DEHYDRATION 15 [Acorus gramineus]|uniref:Protein EARLY RESPONSIVE TO DEHYDRATION 15 n=1 Tax=Acorus gramineus TaxID=55184 RepID=A0AAV8ZZF8_ACOGR|nr:Protein EARLY RESPONSIVE TO DEHYDRATION 15 [Acorus gramineus]
MSSVAVAMAGRSSTLNPDAPLFIPAAYQRVEDFSPEWWALIKTSTWFREHWLLQNQDQDTFDGGDDVAASEGAFEEDDLTDLLPDTFDEFIMYSDDQQQVPTESPMGKEKLKSGMVVDEAALMMDLGGGVSVKHQVEPAKYWEKPVQCVSPKFARRIQQPR